MNLTQFLDSPLWTNAEKAVIRWQYRFLGDFGVALWDAIVRADDDNLARLHLGFPTEVDGFLAWNKGDLANRLRHAGLDI